MGAVTFKMDLSEKVETPFQMMSEKCVSCKVFSTKICLDLQQTDDGFSNQPFFPKIRFDKSFFAAKISLHNDSSVVQSVERRTVNPYVTGSSPVRGATFRKACFYSRLFAFLHSVRLPGGGCALPDLKKPRTLQLTAIKKAPCHQRASFAIRCDYSPFTSAFLISPITFSFLEMSRRSLDSSAFLMM